MGLQHPFIKLDFQLVLEAEEFDKCVVVGSGAEWWWETGRARVEASLAQGMPQLSPGSTLYSEERNELVARKGGLMSGCVDGVDWPAKAFGLDTALPRLSRGTSVGTSVLSVSGVYKVRNSCQPLPGPQAGPRWTRGGEYSLLLADKAAPGTTSLPGLPQAQCQPCFSLSAWSKNRH